jgi:hypothetical protein
MKVKYIFTDQNIFGDPLLLQKFYHVTLQVHHIIVQAVIPFPEQFNDAIMLFIADIQNFKVQGCRTKSVPLRMNEVVINTGAELKLTVFSAVKR